MAPSPSMPTYSLTTWQAAFMAGNYSLALPSGQILPSFCICLHLFANLSRRPPLLKTCPSQHSNSTQLPLSSSPPRSHAFPFTLICRFILELIAPHPDPLLPAPVQGKQPHTCWRTPNFWHLCSRPSAGHFPSLTLSSLFLK